MIYFFACGGSGGHIFPALATAEEIQKRRPGDRVYFICGKRDVENAIFRVAPKERVFAIESAPYRGIASFADPRFLIRLIRGYTESRRLLKQWKPAAVAGFGGYVSFPVILAAKSLGLKTLVHEQNVYPGRANRVLAGLADTLALSFEESAKYFSGARRKKVTGNPIRAAIEKDCRREALDFFEFSGDKKTVLILGGSQGAESVNRLFLDSLEFWDEAMKRELQALHLCGKMRPLDSEARCAAQGISAKAYSFFDRMDLAYGAADFCVGRAGATFLAEIAAKNIPAVLVPYPFADGHQRHNARLFARNHPATVVEQSELTPRALAGLIKAQASSCRVSREASVASPASAREKLADYLSELTQGPHA